MSSKCVQFSTRVLHSAMAVDQVGNPMNATICSSVISESGFDRLNEGQTQQKVGKQCTELEYNFILTRNLLNVATLSFGIFYQRYKE